SMQGRVAPERLGFELEQAPPEAELRQSLNMRRCFRLATLAAGSGPLLNNVLEDLTAHIGALGRAWCLLLDGRGLLRGQFGEEPKQLRLPCKSCPLFRCDATVAGGAFVSAGDLCVLFRRQGHIDPPS